MLAMLNQYKSHITFAALLFIIIGMLAGLQGQNTIKDFALIIATIIASVPIMIKAYQGLRMKSFSIELLVSIAVIGAFYLREYTESSIVTFLFLFGAFLEARTLEKTRASLKELVDFAPQEATVIRGGETMTIPVEEVVLGDIVMIRPGGKIPVDGTIMTGQAHLNEAAITGEAIPSLKKIGDSVFSGAIVDNGYIEVVAEKVGDDTTFARMIELVEEAQESKTKAEKFLDRFAHFYTPAVVVLSIIVFIMTRDVKLAITFLVIACPGALVIGAPVSSVAGIGNGAKYGVLVKGGEKIEAFSKVDTIVFDKTGTLTKGKPEVTDIKSFHQLDPNELLRLVAQAELISEHHLGKTIVQEANERELLQMIHSEKGEVIKGKGVRAKIEGYNLVVGNRKLMEDEHIIISKEAEQYAVNRERAGNTAIFAAINQEVSGIISIADSIRDDAEIALAELRKNGIKQIIMLTGDNRHAAQLVAEKLGLDDYYAELLPENKVEYVKRLKDKGYVVAMAGDGINDAPAIATADIGLAMGEGGTDISIETADVVLMADRLLQLSHAYSLSKATIRNIKQNTYFAVVTVFILLMGVLFGSIHLASGMFIHEASVIFVILNAMRLIRFNLRNKAKTKASVQTCQNCYN